MNLDNDNKLAAEEDIILESAEPLQAEHSPVLRVLIAVGWMGILAGVMGALAALFALASAGKGGDRLMWSVSGAVMCGVIVCVLSFADRKNQRKFELKEKEMMDNAAVYKGTITAAEKHIKKIAYANQIFEEITWQFAVEYKDENDNTVTVKSGRYVNDISKSLANPDVDVYIKANGESVIEGIQIAKKGDTIKQLDVVTVEEG